MSETTPLPEWFLELREEFEFLDRDTDNGEGTETEE
jgi:hypothetical protein